MFSEVLHRTISIFWPNQPKKHLIEIIAENLTFGSETANTAPAHPILPLPTHSVADPYTYQIFFIKPISSPIPSSSSLVA